MFPTKIVDDGLPKRYADHLEKFLLSEFPWLVLDNKWYTPEKPDGVISEGFTLSLCCPVGNPSSPFFNVFSPIPYLLSEKFNYNGPINITQIRPYMQVPTGKPSELNTIHVDYNYPHLVLLQYVNDSDGDTYFFDQDKKTIIDTVEYKANRFVLFDGRHLHTGSSPVKNKRIVISYTLKLESY
jgi:hypothetical protein